MTDAIDGRSLAGVEVEIPGAGSTLTDADGRFFLGGASGRSLPLVVRGDGIHTRETHVAPTSRLAEVDVLPVGGLFDLDFFDHVFRFLGERHTERWTVEPRFEIWAGVYEWFEGEGFGDLVASDETAPERFFAVARDVIAADASKYTGGFLSGSNIVEVPPHPPGTRITYSEYLKAFTTSVILVRGGDASYGGIWPYESGRIYSASIWIQKRYHKDERQVFSHELAHTLGFHHPMGYESVPLPSIMRSAEAVTPQDMLHGRILYRRPPGSRTADVDPESFLVNALLDETEGAPPPAALMRHIRH